jgi:TolA-binding protein
MADRGDYDSAAQHLQAFCNAHPDDDRAEDAAFLLVISLQRAGRTGAARAAADRYLALYPKGFRRAHVEAIARALR